MNRINSTLLQPQEISLKVKTIRSAFWGFMGKGSSEFFRLLGNLILTRLLFPEAFGLMALANSTLLMINLFSDTGIKTAIIQNPKGDDISFLNTAWIISIIRGGILCFIMMILSWPISIFYKEPGLQTILLIMSLNPLISGFENPSLSLFIKKFRVDKLVIFELSLQIIILLSTIILAYIYRSVESMALAVSSGVLFKTAGSFLVAKPYPKFQWDKKSGSEIFDYGKFIFINTMITWMVGNIDIILIGKLLGVGQLAFYNIGKNFAYLAYAVCVQIMYQSYFPAISSVQKDTDSVMRIYKSTVSVFLLIGIPIAMIFSIFAQDIIDLLYDSRYAPSYLSMAWLSLFTIFRIIGGVNGSTLIGIGKPANETLSNLIGLVFTVACLIAGINFGGLKGAVIGISVSFPITAIIESIFLSRIIKGKYGIILHPWIQAFTCSAIIIPVAMFLKHWLLIENKINLTFLILNTILFTATTFGIYRLYKNTNFSFLNKGEIR